MAIDYNLILGGQAPDIVGAMSRGNALAGQVMQQDQARQTRDLYRTQGAGILQGDPNALNALAGIDPATAMDLRAGKQRMDIMSAQEQRAIQEFSARASAEQKAAAVQQIEDAVKMGTAIQDPQTWDQVMSREAPELVGQFAMRDALARKYMTMAEAITAGQGPASPQNPYEERKRAAADLGLAMTDPAYQAFVLTGDLPKGGGAATRTGTVPQGFEEIVAPDGSVSMRPIKGGPEDMSAKMQKAQEEVMAKSQIVLDKIGQAENLLSDAGPLSPVVGFGAGTMAGIGGTGAADMRATVDTIEANMAFDALKAMREASPTGGALGSITEKELALLGATLASLRTDQSPKQFAENLAQLRTIYEGIIKKAQAYPNADQYGLGAAQGGATGGVPAGVDPELWDEMTPEERALFQ